MNRYTLGLVGAPLMWGIGFTLIKQGIEGISLWAFLGVRFWLACLVLGFLFHLKAVIYTKERLKAAVILGVVLFLHIAIQTIGLKESSATRAGFITSLYVPLTPLVNLFVTRAFPSLKQQLLVALAFFGLTLMTWPHQGEGLSSWLHISNGDIMLIVAAVIGALHIVLTGVFAAREENPLALGFWQFVVIALCFTITGFWEGGSSSFEFWNWPGPSLWRLGFVASLGTAFAFVMQIICQKRVDTVKATIIFGLEAPFSLIFGAWMMGDTLIFREGLGAFLLFLASVIP